MPRFAVSLAVISSLVLSLGAAPGGQPAEDLRESYQLLSNTYYARVDAQRMMDGVRDTLSDDAHKHGVRVTLPNLRDSGNADANVVAIAEAISRVQQATHEAGSDLTYDAIDAMARSLRDPYTAFFTPDEYRRFNQALDPEKISGIGVLVEPDPVSKMIRAYYVVPGTPADRAGLQSGDLFAAIDGTPTRGFSQDEASKLLRGKSGTAVHIEPVRDGKRLATLDIVRSEVQPPTVIFKMLPNHVAYIWIMAFGRETPHEFSIALERAQRSDVQAYVVDLRNDGGGYVQSAVDISSKFVSADDTLLTIEQRDTDNIPVPAQGRPLPPKPMVLLVNAGTASASEITAGALQDNGLAVLVGERTYGKGVMQALTELPDGAAIKITTAHYLTPKNRDINLKGIRPDYNVPENKDARFGDADHDAQLAAALNILQKKIAQARP
ncbi:MAG TPA: S41 family peptidase [Candidatus Baltobacteraceae bacterium]|nr:S41 family peptidase [Candidatus Baltobacteraceae bacterium]